jgi:hypothetical protein
MKRKLSNIPERRKITPHASAKNRRKQYIYHGTCFIVFIFAAAYFTFFYNRDFLLWAEEISLFLPTRLFFTESMKTAGGLLNYAGVFFTQFFHYPLLGSLLLILLLLFIRYLTVKAFNLPKPYFPLSFVPAILLLLSVTEPGYELIAAKLPGYFFVGSIGIAICLSGFYLYRKMKNEWMRILFLSAGVSLTYPLFGFYALFTAFLCLLYELFSFIKDKNGSRLFVIAVGILFTGLIPRLFYASIYTRIQWTNIYLQALPNWYDTTGELPLWLPFIFLFLSLTGFLLFLFKETDSHKETKKSLFISQGIFITALFFLYFHSFRDENFKTELQMNQAIEANNWKKAVTIARKRNQTSSLPLTRLIILYYNLALYKLGTAGDQLFAIDHQSVLPSSIYPDLALMHQGGNPVYFHYGKINFCYRWCMENKVEYGLNIQQLKYMIKCSLINGNLTLAGKYNEVLKKTLFYKPLAEKYRQHIDNYPALKDEPEFKSLIPLLAYENKLETDGNQLEKYILTDFASRKGGTPEMLELSLQCNLLLKNGEDFMPRYAFYAQKQKRIPVHYQEAALLFSSLGQTDGSNLKLEQQVVDRFNRWIEMHRQVENQPDKYKKAIFKSSFGNTFWYYYYFVTNFNTETTFTK